MLSGTIFDIQKFCTHDGPGIRTTVFLKGCPLHCQWCHNPESQKRSPEISFILDKCIGCGDCHQACKTGAVSMEINQYDNCHHCAACVQVCQTGARQLIGYRTTVAEVMREVLKDKVFYASTEGGMTISGGEPLYQPAFTGALLRQAKSEGVHTCLETCGYAAEKHFSEHLPFVDLFLFDIKETDHSRHIDYTGVPLQPILHNLEFLNHRGAAIILRCPLIPGLNAREEHCRKIGQLAQRLENVVRVELEPYHPLGIAKSEQIRKAYPLPMLTQFLSPEETQHWVNTISAECSKPVVNLQ